MTLAALGLVLVAAATHAFWNMLARASSDKLAFGTAMNSISALLLTPAAAYFWIASPPAPASLLLLLPPTLLYSAYFFLLAATYERTDLSLSYPIMRGTAVVASALGGYLFMGDRVPPLALVSIALVAAGMFIAQGRLLLRGARSAPLVSRGASLLFPMLTGTCVATSTVWDKFSVSYIHPVIYWHGGLLVASLALLPYMVVRRKGALSAVLRAESPQVAACGLLSALSYLLVLYAFTFTPVTYVATAREVSVVFAALLGALWLHESQGPRRALGAAVIFLGVATLALAR